MHCIARALTILSLGSLSLVAAPLAGEVGATIGVEALAHLGTADAAFIRRRSITKKGNIGSYRSTVVVADDPNDDVDHVVVAVQGLDGAPEPTSPSYTLDLRLTQGNGDKQFVASDLEFQADAADGEYSFTVELRRADGTLVNPPVTTEVGVTPVRDSRVRTARIEQVDEENFLLSVVVIGDASVDRIGISYGDFAGPEPTESDFTIIEKTVKNNGAKKTFTALITFEEAEAAVDEVYEVVVDLLDGNGQALGAAEIDVAVRGLE